LGGRWKIGNFVRVLQLIPSFFISFHGEIEERCRDRGKGGFGAKVIIGFTR
jgi:hypothetical protein